MFTIEADVKIKHPEYGIGTVITVQDSKAAVNLGKGVVVVDIADLSEPAPGEYEAQVAVEQAAAEAEQPTPKLEYTKPLNSKSLRDDPEFDDLASGPFYERTLHEWGLNLNPLNPNELPALEIIRDDLVTAPEAAEGAQTAPAEEVAAATPLAPQAATVLRTFNEKYYVVGNLGGKCVVCEEDDVRTLKHQSYRAFQGRYLAWATVVGTKEIGVGDKKVSVPVHQNAATFWLRDPSHRRFDSVTFAPGEDLGRNVRNLWRGFAVQPIKGDCSLYLNHLRDNICKSDPEKFRWLVCWMAWKVKNPGIKCYTAIVLRGSEGCGKNICFDGFGSLFGPHALVVTNQGHVSGHFNAHLRACCLLCANEAYFAGARQHESSLKGLISDDYHLIESKGVDAVNERNRIGLFIMSNESWVVPASAGARRFTVFDCGDEHAQDTKYFKAIVNQMNNGGREALLYHLQNEVDFSDFDERKPLITDALSDQQAQSTRGVENLWFECLVRGTLPFTSMSDGTNFLRADSLLSWARMQGQYEWKGLRAEHVGHLLSGNSRGVYKGMNFRKKEKPRGWLIPSLHECRELWNKLRFKYDWDDPNAEWDLTNP